MTTTQPALLHTALFPLNEEKTAYKIDLGGAVQHLNTTYRLTVANSGMTEEAWDALNAHLSMLESFVRAIQEEYFN